MITINIEQEIYPNDVCKSRKSEIRKGRDLWVKYNRAWWELQPVERMCYF